MAQDKRKVISVCELVESLKIPRPFLRKILQVLNKKRVLKSYKGQGGGFELALAPEKIFLLNLIEVFQGSLKINECIFKKAPCPNMKRCKLKKKLDSIQRFAISELEDITLATLLGR